MTDSVNSSHLRRLFFLRNLAITGQVFTIALAIYLFNIALPLKPMALIVSQLIIFNIYTWLRLGHHSRVTEKEIFIHLAFDILALAFLLYFSGGATNPFIILFLFPLVISVTILPIRYSWILAVFAVACYSFLMFTYQPLVLPDAVMGHDMGSMSHDMSGHDMHGGNSENREFNLHVTGMWLGFILIAGLITYYVFGMAQTIKRQQKDLASAREQTLRDEQLVNLGTLAASTAHELGTPLATMSLLADEIKAELNDAPDTVVTDLDYLKSQIQRCKSALSELSHSANASPLQGGEALSVEEYLNRILAEIKLRYTSDSIETHWEYGDSRASILADRTLTQALINILDNAIEVSPEKVEWTVSWDQQQLTMDILDYGPGISEQAKDNVGNEPYSEKDDGLGIGLYLAHAVVKRFGGDLQQDNHDKGGCVTHIVLPLFSEAKA